MQSRGQQKQKKTESGRFLSDKRQREGGKQRKKGREVLQGPGVCGGGGGGLTGAPKSHFNRTRSRQLQGRQHGGGPVYFFYFLSISPSNFFFLRKKRKKNLNKKKIFYFRIFPKSVGPCCFYFFFLFLVDCLATLFLYVIEPQLSPFGLKN